MSVYVLSFSSVSGQKEPPAFASDAQVRRLLERVFKDEGGDLSRQASLFTLTNIDTPETKQGERFSKMRLKVNHVNAQEKALFSGWTGRILAWAQMEKTLKDALNTTAEEFADRPQPERLENFDSQLAGATRLSALYAILASWGAILLYLWFRFGSWTFGAATVLCLIHDLFFTLGAIGLAHYLHGTWFGNILGLGDFKIDSNTVAALLTLVGYSVSDTIVVFDRIREVRGKNPELTPKMINDAVNQALSRTLLTSVTVWLVVIVLYIFGGEGVHLFAFVMVVGVVVGTYSSIYIASPLLLIFGEGRLAAGQKSSVPQVAAR
jgi:SecD/SecF fusion protein